MYLNLYQKYILEQLEKYGCLYKRQLEFLTKFFVEEHLPNIDGYVAQLRRFNMVNTDIYMGEPLVSLPQRSVNENVLTAMDVMIEFAEHISHYERGHGYVDLRFYIRLDDGEREINICSLTRDNVNALMSFVEEYMSVCAGKSDSEQVMWIFVVTDHSLINGISCEAEHSFAIKERGKVEFYESSRK